MITRKWLKSLGASDYLAKRLTQSLDVAGHQGHANVYKAEAVLTSAQTHSQRPRIQPRTQQLLVVIAVALEEWISSEAASPAISSKDVEDPLAAAMAKVSQANQKFEATAQAARKISSDFETYRAGRGTDFKSRNNVVTFA